MNELRLNQLALGLPGVTEACGESMAQCAAVCLDHQRHSPGVMMTLDGDRDERCKLYWDQLTDQARRTWADLQEATELGACGIAALLVERFTDMTVFQRSWKGTGFDYWLARKGSESLLFQCLSPLEVSGILNGRPGQVDGRVKEKMRQVRRGGGGFSALVIVVEFGAPRSRMVSL